MFLISVNEKAAISRFQGDDSLNKCKFNSYQKELLIDYSSACFVSNSLMSLSCTSPGTSS